MTINDTSLSGLQKEVLQMQTMDYKEAANLETKRESPMVAPDPEPGR